MAKLGRNLGSQTAIFCDKSLDLASPYLWFTALFIFFASVQGSHLNRLTLNIILPTSTHSFKEQYVIYDYNSFVADVGGYLGLLLGHSLMGMATTGFVWVTGRMS